MSQSALPEVSGASARALAHCAAKRTACAGLFPRRVYTSACTQSTLPRERQRPLVIGRKNWIHLGSQQAGPKVAAILSVVESCRRLKIPIREYLSAVLPGLADFPLQRIKARTPPAWAAVRG